MTVVFQIKIRTDALDSAESASENAIDILLAIHSPHALETAPCLPPLFWIF